MTAPGHVLFLAALCGLVAFIRRWDSNPPRPRDEWTQERAEAAQRALAAAGFNDIDTPRLAFAFAALAKLCRDRPETSFGDCNARVGNAHGLGSGWVARHIRYLHDLGYLTVTETGGVRLTDRGARAAPIVGVEVGSTGPLSTPAQG